MREYLREFTGEVFLYKVRRGITETLRGDGNTLVYQRGENTSIYVALGRVPKPFTIAFFKHINTSTE